MPRASFLREGRGIFILVIIFLKGRFAGGASRFGDEAAFKPSHARKQATVVAAPCLMVAARTHYRHSGAVAPIRSQMEISFAQL